MKIPQLKIVHVPYEVEVVKYFKIPQLQVVEVPVEKEEVIKIVEVPVEIEIEKIIEKERIV